MPLYDFQAANNSLVRDLELFSVKPPRLCVQSPTGSGKSFMMRDLLEDDKPQIMLTHRRVLLDQLARGLKAAGITFGMRAAGEAPNSAAPVQLGMIQTEYARTFRTKRTPMVANCQRVLIDEPHAMVAATTHAVLHAYWRAGASLVGFTATPKNCGALFDRLLVAATPSQLIERGFLVPPIMFGPDMPDMRRLERVKRDATGDFQPKSLRKVWDAQAIFGRVILHYKLFNPEGKPTILFAQGVANSLWFAMRLSAEGIPAAHIDGDNVWVDGQFYKSDRAAREAVFARLRSGNLKVLCNCFVLREGYDEPCIAHVIFACAFGCRSSFVQAGGRGMRAFAGKEFCTFQDHGGNWFRFASLDSDEPWDMHLDERTAQAMRDEKRRNQTHDEDGPPPLEPIYCPQCAAIRYTGDECPLCGFRYKKKSRMVVQLSGELKLVTGNPFRKHSIVRTRDSAQEWRGLYWGNKKNHPSRTFQQIWSYAALKNNWRCLPRDLPLMPLRERHWFLPIGEVDLNDLR